MKFGIVPINLGEFTDPEVMTALVQKAETLGYESVWTAEHVIIPKTYESVYPYSPSGKLAFLADAAIIDPFAARHRGEYFTPDESTVSGQVGVFD